ncbi:DUF3598 domain-containing protein [Nostoc sp. CHAB 5834]|nr:DUF3598 domain-containing protein [Nostoc sp. CHAB 5834]
MTSSLNPIGNRAALSAVMPSILLHEGVWEGTYRHVDADGRLIDRHQTRVVCTFPDEGPYAYVQSNTFTWEDGRIYQVDLPGILSGDRLHWDTETFHGTAWEAGDGVVLLNLARYDEPGARFFEKIVMGQSGDHRSRTWQWFRDGRLYKRTLCDEQRVSR